MLPSFKRKILILLIHTCLFQAACIKKPAPQNTEEKEKSPAPPELTLDKAFSWPPVNNKPFDLVPDAQRTDKNFYVVLDGSGSMSKNDCAENSSKQLIARNALQRFVKEIPPNANLGLLIFDDRGISERVPLGKDNRDAFIAAMEKSTAGGGTPLKSAIAKGREHLETQARKQASYGEYNLIVVTDGESDGGEEPNTIVDKLVKDTPIIIHTIGFCIGEKHSLNQPNKTSYRAADSLSELMSGLKEVLAESESFQVKDFK